MTYKINDEYAAKYDIPELATEIPPEYQYKIGQYVDILDEDKKLLARFEVKWSNGKEVGGKIINTFGHKRKKKFND